MRQSNFSFVSGPALSRFDCEQLSTLLDVRFNGEPDLKLAIGKNELGELLDPSVASRLFQLFGDRIDEVYLRRVASYGQCINFHLDHSKRTMQVPLNGDTEYVGGRLAYITANGVEFPE